GKDDAGYDVLTTRLKQSKQTCEEVKNLFHERALIEEEYAKRLSKLSKIPVGKDEIGSLHDALETVRQELEATAKEHIGLSQKIRAELEQDLADFIAKQREKRKLQQNVVEASLRNKQTQ
ncbi:24346_t:CDS:2, partial [Gigaspora margarita]